MKKKVQSISQKLLGFQNYLFVFSLWKINSLKWNKNETDFIKFLSLIPEHANVLDLGANIGIMTTHLSRKLKQGYVYAFEPASYNFNTLVKIVKFLNLKNVKLFKNALGNENKTIKMVLPVVENVKMQGLTMVANNEDQDNFLTFEVTQLKLDEIEELKHVVINAIKIDVENYEYEVFKGASELINRDKPIVYCELWDNEIKNNVFNFFTALGYGIYVFHENALVPVSSAPAKTNYFFIYGHA